MKPAAASGEAPKRAALSTDFYSILGLRPGADGQKIKAAYRTLAKRFHPDFNLGDRAAEQRTKEINTAYRILTDPQTRAAYDDELASRRAQARRRFWRSVATGVAAFAVTAGLVPLVLLMRQDGPRPRPEAVQRIALAKSKGAEAAAPETPAAEPEARPEGEPPVLPSLESKPTTREDIEPSSERAEIEAVQPPQDGTRPAGAGPSLASLERAGPEEQPPVSEATPAAAAGRAKPAVWKLYRNARAGFALKYPADVFAAGAGADEDDDRLLVSRDGQALLRISAAPNAAAASPADYRRRLIEQRYAGAAIDYQPQREDWFVLSGTVGQEMFYERVTFSCDRRRVHGWLLVYPVAERTYFDPIVEEMHRSYRVEPLSATRCGTIEPGEGVRASGHKGRRPPQT